MNYKKTEKNFSPFFCDNFHSSFVLYMYLQILRKERNKMTDNEKQYFSEIYEKYAKSVYGVCLLYLKNKEDAEEAVSELFIRIMENKPSFENDSHEKAYLMRTSVNICKNILKSGWKKNTVHDEDVLMYMTTSEEESIMEEILELPPKYRVIIYMHYYQGYKAQEIANIMNMSLSGVLSRLSRGRKKLKDILIEGGFLYEKRGI